MNNFKFIKIKHKDNININKDIDTLIGIEGELFNYDVGSNFVFCFKYGRYCSTIHSSKILK